MEVQTLFVLFGCVLVSALIVYLLYIYRIFPLHQIYKSKVDLENIFDSIDDPLTVIDEAYTIIRSNKAYINLVNRSFTEILSKKCYFVLRGRSEPCDDCRMLDVLQTGKKSEVNRSLYAAPGHRRAGIITLAFYPFFGKSTTQPFIVEHIRDVTQLETLKIHLEEQNRTLIDTKATLEDIQIKMSHDIEMAQQVHHGLLLKDPPKIKGIKMSLTYHPIESVGGDVYHFIPFGPDKLGIFMGDATGHGLPAAFVGAIAKMSLYNHTKEELEPKELIARLHHDLVANIQTNHYMTCFWGIIDSAQHTITFTRAGHPKPILIRKNGDILHLDTIGTLIGFIDMPMLFENNTVALLPGDRLYIFTDGIYEILERNGTNDTPMGYRKFQEILMQCNHKPLDELIPEITGKLSRFVYKDDYSLIILEIE